MSPERLPRRLACIVFADVVGYSRLTDENEEQTFHSLQAGLGLFSSIMTEHGGRVINRAGDALLVSFDSAIGAISASLAAQRAIGENNINVAQAARVTLRVGINVGDIIENGSDIFGHGINVAARIQTVAESGGICVSETVKQLVPNDLGIVFRSIGERTFKNLKDPLHIFAIDLQNSKTPVPPVISQPLDIPSAGLAKPADAVAASSLRRVLVLPFSVFSDNPDHVYLADGLCEDLITELSRFKSIAVLARTTAFAFKGTTKTIREVAKELNVSYVLEGSLRPVASKMRVTAQLIDTSSEDHVWAEKYDFEMSDLLLTQDKIISRIVSILEGRIVEQRLKAIDKLGPRSLDAYDCWLKGHALMQSWSIGDDQAALAYFERAAEIDPTFARPRGSMAGIYSAWALLTPGSPDISDFISRAREHAHAAVRLDPADGKVQTYLGWVNMLERAFVAAEVAFDAAGDSNPNDAEIAISRALAYAYLGDTARASDLARHAFNLDPYRPSYYYGYRAVIMFLIGDYTTSIDLFERMRELAPVDLMAWYASALAHLGEHERGRAAASTFLKNATAEWNGDSAPAPQDILDWFFRVTPLRRAGDLDRLRSGLLTVGLLLK